MLSKDNYTVMEMIKNGATILHYSVAKNVREIQDFDRGLVTIINISDLEEVTGEMYTGIERVPYFGAILTDKGVKVLQEYKEGLNEL